MASGIHDASISNSAGHPGAAASLQPELLSLAQMDERAAAIAGWHLLAADGRGSSLAERLRAGGIAIAAARETVEQARIGGHRIPEAGRLLLEGMPVVEHHLRLGARLAAAHARESLPILGSGPGSGPGSGRPRIYDIAFEIVNHSDCRIDLGGIRRFFSAYQATVPLRQAELRAFPRMTRLALLDAIRGIAARLQEGTADRGAAARWADRIERAAVSDPGELFATIGDMTRENPPLSVPFVAEFSRRLRGRGFMTALALVWVEQRLAEIGLTIDVLVQAGNREEAADRLSIENALDSLGKLDSMDWEAFTLETSVVERILQGDPQGTYARTHPDTRAFYRAAVEGIAAEWGVSEAAAAQRAVDLARQAAASKGAEDPAAHAGFYLVPEGRRAIEAEWLAAAESNPLEAFARRHADALYLAAVLSATIVLAAALLWKAPAGAATWLNLLLAVPAVIAANELAAALVTMAVARAAAAAPLPRMDFSEGIPASAATLVALPGVLASGAAVDDLLDRLEKEYAAQHEPHVVFALLSDLSDAAEEALPEDAALVEAAVRGIRGLNAAYSASGEPAFFLFHRARKWNPDEEIWMGFERKRGILAELNSVLCGGPAEGFEVIEGSLQSLEEIKYVLVLDAAAELPGGGVRRLVEAMAHPLNQPGYDETQQRVARGFGILQPVLADDPEALSSWYARLRAPDTNYRSPDALSDFYQDILREDSFSGAAIYDVDVFERLLHWGFPENRLAGDGFLEGSYGRSGIVNDFVIRTNVSASFRRDALRRRRQIRADWQVAPWILPGVPGPAGQPHENPLSILARWKIFDRLRRSLVPPALMLLLAADRLTNPGIRSAFVLLVVLLPALKRVGMSVRSRPLAAALEERALHAVCLAAFLPYEALVCAEAVLRGVLGALRQGRLLTSRPAAFPQDARDSAASMWAGPIAGAIFLAWGLWHAGPLDLLHPVALLWLVSPVLLQWSRLPAPLGTGERREAAEGDAGMDPPAPARTASAPGTRIVTAPVTQSPAVHLLSNGRYHTVVTSAGGGYSLWNGYAITRWREDPTRDHHGTFCYIRDAASGALWSAALQPTLQPTAAYRVVFRESDAEFRGRLHGIEAELRIAISPEDDVELRRLRVTNRSRHRRTLDVASYAEVVLVPLGNPAEGGCALRMDFRKDRTAILCAPRTDPAKGPWLFHLASGGAIQTCRLEADRRAFIGRGTVRKPHGLSRALSDPVPETGSSDSAEEPILGIRCRVVLEPGESAAVDFVTGIAAQRADADALIEKYADTRFPDRLLHMAEAYGSALLEHLNAAPEDVPDFNRLAGAVIYANPAMRAHRSILSGSRRSRSGLLAYGLSGNLPIVLVRLSKPEDLAPTHWLMTARRYWAQKGLLTELILWIEEGAAVLTIPGGPLAPAGEEAENHPAAVVLAGRIPAEDRDLLQASARVILDASAPLKTQLDRLRSEESAPRGAREARIRPPYAAEDGRVRQDGSVEGGFDAGGHEYVLRMPGRHLALDRRPHVIASPSFGCLVGEDGASSTWDGSGFFVTASGEAVYIQDEASGAFWSAAPFPAGGAGAYTARQGFGYAAFEHDERGVRSTMRTFVAMDAPVRFISVELANDSEKPRRLSATLYVEWILGQLSRESAMHVLTEIDPSSGALFASNAYEQGPSARLAFLAADSAQYTLTADRTEFLGRNGTPAKPDAMTSALLSGHVGAGLDPCGALRVRLELGPGQLRRVVFMLGTSRSAHEARQILRRFRAEGAADRALGQVRTFWEQALGLIRVQTPDPRANLLVNGWILYRTLAARLWQRSALDRRAHPASALPDALAFAEIQPQLLRDQLLAAASAPADGGSGSLWLSIAALRYVEATEDAGILDEPVRLAEPARAGGISNPRDDGSRQSTTLYERCTAVVIDALKSFHYSKIERCEPDGVRRILRASLSGLAGLARVRGDTGLAKQCETEIELVGDRGVLSLEDEASLAAGADGDENDPAAWHRLALDRLSDDRALMDVIRGGKSSAWIYRAIVGSVLGLRREGRMLHVSPRLPEHWQECTVRYGHHESRVDLTLKQGQGSRKISLEKKKESSQSG